jgi:hypothetical protein
VRRALISDIHGKLEALNAVLANIVGQRINEIFCLGDLVSYGPNPFECIDRVKANCRITYDDEDIVYRRSTSIIWLAGAGAAADSSCDSGFAHSSDAKSASTPSGSTGLTRWWSNPASR